MSVCDIHRLGATFAAEVRDVDLSCALDATTLEGIARAFVQHKVLLFRDQDLTPDDFARFAIAWGTPRVDGFQERNVPGYDFMSTVGNVGGVNSCEEYRNGASFWHTDGAAEADPDATTMLWCLEAPAKGGETLIADMGAAWRGLDPQTRRAIEPLTGLHMYSGTGDILGGREDFEHPLQPVTDETAGLLPPAARRPVARPHTLTGEKALYSPAGSMVAIDGMESGAACELMRRLKLHAISGRYTWTHRYRQGDLLMWDNTVTLHCARPIGAPETPRDHRLLYRIVPLGLPRPLRSSIR